MDQVDSVNITYDRLREAQERIESLENGLDDLFQAVRKGQNIEVELNERLLIRDSLDTEKDNFIEYQRKQNNKLRRQNKFFKFFTPTFGVLAVIEGIYIYLRR